MAESTLFKPSGDFEWLREYFHVVPKILFRTFSPCSNGINGPHRIASAAAAKNGQNQTDLLSRDVREATSLLTNHLLWQKQPDDNLVSWTSSPLFAIQHAIRRENTDEPHSPSDRIYICVIPTGLFPKQCFMSAPGLLQAYKVRSEGKLTHEYYAGEFLSQGALNLNAGTSYRLQDFMTTLDKMVSRGLYDLFPRPEGDQTTQLYLRVLVLRRAFQSPPTQPTDREISSARKIATQCFRHDKQQAIVFAALLSLRPRFCLDDSIFSSVTEIFNGDCPIQEEDLESIHSSLRRVPEHTQLVKMLHNIVADQDRAQQKADASDLQDSVNISGLSTVVQALNLDG